MKTIICAFLLLLSPMLVVASTSERKTICLNMIVKNESKVIARCLESVLPIIDYWVIVDTGSTDGTQKIITDFMQLKGIPGELHECPWVDFAHNRNEALQLAYDKGDYCFFIDSDDYLIYEPGFKLPALDRDRYYLTIDYCGLRYAKPSLINNHLKWTWKGVLHEILYPVSPITSYATLENIRNFVTREGSRSQDSEKYQKDAQILETALEKEPDNSQYVFYLAQSYRDAKNYPLALKNYEKCIQISSWDQEHFYSLLQIGILQETLKKPSDLIVQGYRRAYQFRPLRAEPLYYLASYYRKQGNYTAGYETAKLGLTLPPSTDLLFVEKWVYDYGLLLEFSICAYWIEKYEECQTLCLHLLKKPDLPTNIRECVERNLGFANTKILDRVCINNQSEKNRTL